MRSRDALKFGTPLCSSCQQQDFPASAQNRMKMTTDIPPSITTPDKVETRIGTLKFYDGFPTRPPSRKSTTTSISSAACRHT